MCTYIHIRIDMHIHIPFTCMYKYIYIYLSLSLSLSPFCVIMCAVGLEWKDLCAELWPAWASAGAPLIRWKRGGEAACLCLFYCREGAGFLSLGQPLVFSVCTLCLSVCVCMVCVVAFC